MFSSTQYWYRMVAAQDESRACHSGCNAWYGRTRSCASGGDLKPTGSILNWPAYCALFKSVLADYNVLFISPLCIIFYDTASFQTLAAWPPINRCTCVPARQRHYLHVPYQICYHFLKNTKKYRRGDARQNPPEIPGANTPSAARVRACTRVLKNICLRAT
jgi:hypothetical protein